MNRPSLPPRHPTNAATQPPASAPSERTVMSFTVFTSVLAPTPAFLLRSSLLAFLALGAFLAASLAWQPGLQAGAETPGLACCVPSPESTATSDDRSVPTAGREAPAPSSTERSVERMPPSSELPEPAD